MTEATGPDLREAIARVIDPRGWHIRDERYARHKTMTWPVGPTTREDAERSADSYTIESFRKAAACLALLTPAHPDPEWPEREAWLSEIEAEAREAWSERQEACAKYGADISMPSIFVQVDKLLRLIAIARAAGGKR